MRKVEILDKIQKEINKETGFCFLKGKEDIYSVINEFMDLEIDLTHKKDYRFTKGDWVHKLTFTEDKDMEKIYINLKSENRKEDNLILAFVGISM